MPKKVCNEPRCPNYARPGSGKCDAHQREYERLRSARRREATSGVYKRARWQTRRRQVLERDPFCADGRLCHGRLPSMHVDHVKPLDAGGDPYSLTNLRGSCAPCHELKTSLENQGRTPEQVEAQRLEALAQEPLPLEPLMQRSGMPVIPPDHNTPKRKDTR